VPYPADLTVIVVSYNTRERLCQALTNIDAGKPAGPLLVVVDNASADGSADAVASGFPGVTLVRSQENIGFARAVNLGLERLDTKFGLLLNPDTMPTHALLAALVETLEADPGIWAVAPRLLRADGRAQAMDAGFQPRAGRAVTYFLGLAELLPLPPIASFCVPSRVREPLEVDWLSGACLCFRRQAIEVVGPLDPSYFLYGEDVDWCRRVQNHGGRIVLRGDLGLSHAQGASSGHDVRSTEWLRALDRGYVRPIMGRGAAVFFAAASIGFGLRAARAMLPGYARRPATLAGYARTAATLAVKALQAP
jgi:N-acetylglucosaminyl-diphospho-decaprenol L-rhamnosyltransferase